MKRGLLFFQFPRRCFVSPPSMETMVPRQPPGPGINLIRPDGAGKFRLVVGSNPEWSPDGSKLVYESSGGSIAIINADGSGGRTLTIDGTSPTWSPDGTRITCLGQPDESLAWLEGSYREQEAGL